MSLTEDPAPDVAAARRVAADRRAAEHWFADHGLPWFVEQVDVRVARLMAPRRIIPLGVLAGVIGAAAARATSRWGGDLSTSGITGVSAAVLVVLIYAGGPLRVATMARWAAGRVLRELSLLLPLVTRALPLLLLFMTFLFVNTEVWQVGAALDRSRLWAVVWLFVTLGVAFLLTRLPREVRRVEAGVQPEEVLGVCTGTPLAGVAATLRAGDLPAEATSLSPTQRANLVLVLLVAQAFQVLLLVLAVFAFFIGFGLLAIAPEVIEAWVGHPPTPLQLWGIPLRIPVSDELFQVAAFLSAFAGLYFIVYAVSDATYREQFFAELDAELEQAVGVRAVYRTLLDGPSEDT
ncbi:MAG: hypothetical protein JNL54_09080 [Kineosporiaceae bacterium]|nr:hypothetical protein [Kineosporiaceae bacterium]